MRKSLLSAVLFAVACLASSNAQAQFITPANETGATLAEFAAQQTLLFDHTDAAAGLDYYTCHFVAVGKVQNVTLTMAHGTPLPVAKFAAEYMAGYDYLYLTVVNPLALAHDWADWLQAFYEVLEYISDEFGLGLGV